MRKVIALLAAVLLACGVMVIRFQNKPSPLGIGEPIGVSGNMWCLTTDAVEGAQIRQLLGTKDGLLFFTDDGRLTMLSQEDLTVIAEAKLEVSSLAYAQILDDGISVADPERGTVTLFTPELEAAGVYEAEPAAELWMMGHNGGTLYACSGAGLYARDLLSGVSQMLLEPGYVLQPYARTPQYLTLAHLGGDLRERWYRLELGTGSLTELGEAAPIAASKSLFPLDDGRYLYRNGRAVTFYEGDGAFLCYGMFSVMNDPPGTSTALDPVWSERWQGYFFIDHCGGAQQLIFLDPSVAVPGVGLSLTETPPPGGEVLPRELYDRASELSERFGVDLRIADQCQLDYNTFQSHSFDDPRKVADALDILEQALEKYPQGYLEQLKYGTIRRIRIELVSRLKPDSEADVSSTAAAFSRERKREYLIVLDGDVLKETNLHHELAHVLDKRIGLSAKLREDALFSEEDWMALQPEGFAYADSYRDISDDVKAFYDSGYFARNYACVSATEDKATMMECAIMGRSDIYAKNPHLLPKLQYYCDCIRDSFDTTGWPETLPWEYPLR